MALGRLKEDATPGQAEAEMNAVAGRIAQEDSSYAGFGARVVPLQEQLVGDVRPSLLILFAAVGLVMLIVCANLANLIMARVATRRREVAIRAAVGASRGRLVRQLLTESMVIALGGGLLGLLWAVWGVDLLIAISPQTLPRADEIGVDTRVSAFVLLTSLLTGLMFGLPPAVRASKSDLGAWLKEGGGGVAGGARRNRAQSLLVVSEVAVTLVLLSGAGLMLNSFVRLIQVDPGFDPEKVITFRFVLPASKYPEKHQQAAFFRELLEGVTSLPEVRTAGMARNLPVSGQSMTSPVIVEGRPPAKPGEQPPAQHVAVDPGYFSAIGIRLTEGRAFSERDGAEAPPVAVINETLARRFFPGEDPVGKRLRTMFGSPPVMRQVVGVVADVKHGGLGRETPPQVFVPFAQNPERFMTLVVKAGASPSAVVTAVRGAVRAVDPDQPIDQVATMEALLSESVAQPRFYTLLLGSFGAAALLMAVVGIYGVMSYTVTQRTHEIGVRMALGARPADILRMVVGQGMALVALGVASGLAGTAALTRYLTALLYGVGPSDPTTFAAVILLLTCVALAACYAPARRATKVDPLIALRVE
jgi:putative ABC transport system permease protein